MISLLLFATSLSQQSPTNVLVGFVASDHYLMAEEIATLGRTPIEELERRTRSHDGYLVVNDNFAMWVDPSIDEIGAIRSFTRLLDLADEQKSDDPWLSIPLNSLTESQISLLRDGYALPIGEGASGDLQILAQFSVSMKSDSGVKNYTIGPDVPNPRPIDEIQDQTGSDPLEDQKRPPVFGPGGSLLPNWTVQQIRWTLEPRTSYIALLQKYEDQVAKEKNAARTSYQSLIRNLESKMQARLDGVAQGTRFGAMPPEIKRLFRGQPVDEDATFEGSTSKIYFAVSRKISENGYNVKRVGTLQP